MVVFTHAFPVLSGHGAALSGVRARTGIGVRYCFSHPAPCLDTWLTIACAQDAASEMWFYGYAFVLLVNRDAISVKEADQAQHLPWYGSW
jgi:hypothetical protein